MEFICQKYKYQCQSNFQLMNKDQSRFKAAGHIAENENNGVLDPDVLQHTRSGQALISFQFQNVKW